MTTTDQTLFTIGDVARRTGLAVSAVRYYSDEGVVDVAETTPAGHRLYDVEAIARLELVRTLRDLGTGLEQVRRLHAGETTLHQLLAEHLEVVEQQEGELRVRRAVLRALVRANDPADRAALLRRLVTMPDAERERLVEDFWRDVSAELPQDFAARIHAEPRLPDDPTVEQLEAWVELAELVQDAQFRASVRAYFHEVYATGPGPRMTTSSVQDFIADGAGGVTPKILAAVRSGLPAEAPYAQELAVRFVEETAQATGVAADDAFRERMAARLPVMGAMYTESLDDPEYDASHGRYLALVATINDEAPAVADDVDMAEVGRWMSQALAASLKAG